MFGTLVARPISQIRPGNTIVYTGGDRMQHLAEVERSFDRPEDGEWGLDLDDGLTILDHKDRLVYRVEQ